METLKTGLEFDPDTGINDWLSLPKIQWFDRHNPSIHRDHEYDVYYRIVLFNSREQFNNVRRQLQVSVDMNEGQERMMFLRPPVNVLFVGYMPTDELGQPTNNIHWHSAYVVRATDEYDAFDYIVHTYGVRGLSPLIRPLLQPLLAKSPLCRYKKQAEEAPAQEVQQVPKYAYTREGD